MSIAVARETAQWVECWTYRHTYQMSIVPTNCHTDRCLFSEPDIKLIPDVLALFLKYYSILWQNNSDNLSQYFCKKKGIYALRIIAFFVASKTKVFNQFLLHMFSHVVRMKKKNSGDLKMISYTLWLTNSKLEKEKLTVSYSITYTLTLKRPGTFTRGGRALRGRPVLSHTKHCVALVFYSNVKTAPVSSDGISHITDTLKLHIVLLRDSLIIHRVLCRKVPGWEMNRQDSAHLVRWCLQSLIERTR